MSRNLVSATISEENIITGRRTRRIPRFLEDNYVLEDATWTATDLDPEESRSKRVEKSLATSKAKRDSELKKKRSMPSSTSSPPRKTSPKKKSSPKKTTPKKKTPARARPSTSTSSTSSSYFSGDSGGSYFSAMDFSSGDSDANMVSGINERSTWKLSALEANSRSKYSIDNILSGCYTDRSTTTPSTSFGSSLLEIAFVFDTTGSMFRCLAEVKEKVQSMAKQLLNDLPGLRIAILAMGDYCDYRTYYTLKKLDFTSDIDRIVNFVQRLNGSGGGDAPECYELALLEAQGLSWSTCDRKALVVIGDEVPHKPDEYFNINWRTEVSRLKEQQVRIYSVQCLARDHATDFYSTMATTTEGKHFKLANFEEMREMFMGLIYRESTEAQLDAHAGHIATSTGYQVMLPTSTVVEADSTEDDENLGEAELKAIHAAIHDPTSHQVEIRGVSYPLSVGTAGCRFVNVLGITYIEQNKEKDNNYAKLAAEGKKITWICRRGLWGLIIDDEIVR